MSHEPSKLIAYWLGTLPPTELEQIEADSFADDAFFHQLHDAKDLLIKTYLQQQLGPAERQQFEESFLKQPGRFYEVALMKAALSYRDTQAQPEKQSLWGRLNRLIQANELNSRSKGWVVVYPALATIVLMIGLSGFWFLWRNEKTSAPSQVALPVAGGSDAHQAQILRWVAKHRGEQTSADPVLQKHEGLQNVKLQFVLEFDTHTQYGFKLTPKEQNNSVLRQQEGLTAQPVGNEIRVNAEMAALSLPVGSYEVVLYGIEKQGTVTELRHYYFTVH